jgi:hypothetical protein
MRMLGPTENMHPNDQSWAAPPKTSRETGPSLDAIVSAVWSIHTS